MKKKQFILTVVFALLTGLIIGATATYFLAKPVKIRSNFHKHHARKIKRIVKKLDLNKQQEKQFYDIHLRYMGTFCSVMNAQKPKMLQLMEDEKKEIDLMLSPEQKKKFHDIRSKQLARFNKKFANFELFKKQLIEKQ